MKFGGATVIPTTKIKITVAPLIFVSRATTYGKDAFPVSEEVQFFKTR